MNGIPTLGAGIVLVDLLVVGPARHCCLVLAHTLGGGIRTVGAVSQLGVVGQLFVGILLPEHEVYLAELRRLLGLDPPQPGQLEQGKEDSDNLCSILDVDKARTVVVIKRSLSPGFAGIPNPLFAADNCLMFFGDGKKAVLDLTAALKE